MRLTLIRILVIAVLFLVAVFAMAIAWPIALVDAYVVEQILEPLITTKI